MQNEVANLKHALRKLVLSNLIVHGMLTYRRRKVMTDKLAVSFERNVYIG
jgi:hypothetical protein